MSGSPNLYSYGDPIHIGRGPKICAGVPISTIDIGMGVPISMCMGPQIYIALGTRGPHTHMTPALIAKFN